MGDDRKPTPWDRQREWEREQKAKLGISRPLEETAFLLHECEKINEEQADRIEALTAALAAAQAELNGANELLSKQAVALAAAQEERGRLREHIVPVMAALAAAISLLERSPKTAAPSDKMFDLMLSDYRRAVDNARAALQAETPGGPAQPYMEWIEAGAPDPEPDTDYETPGGPA